MGGNFRNLRLEKGLPYTRKVRYFTKKKTVVGGPPAAYYWLETLKGRELKCPYRNGADGATPRTDPLLSLSLS